MAAGQDGGSNLLVRNHGASSYSPCTNILEIYFETSQKKMWY